MDRVAVGDFDASPHHPNCRPGQAAYLLVASCASRSRRRGFRWLVGRDHARTRGRNRKKRDRQRQTDEIDRVCLRHELEKSFLAVELFLESLPVDLGLGTIDACDGSCAVELGGIPLLSAIRVDGAGDLWHAELTGAVTSP
jgi:hypothetical protein